LRSAEEKLIIASLFANNQNFVLFFYFNKFVTDQKHIHMNSCCTLNAGFLAIKLKHLKSTIRAHPISLGLFMMKIDLRVIAAAITIIGLTACGGTSPTSGEPDIVGTVPSQPGEQPVADNSDSINEYKPVTGTTDHDANKPLNFLIVGDQGTAGTSAFGGGTTQAELSQTMGVICDAKKTASNAGCHFAIAAGDNFYDAGVTGPTDDRFRVTFEEIYSHLEIPFYLILGNHDNGLSGDAINLGDNQTVYSHLNEDSPEWAAVSAYYSGYFEMPARYYSQRFGSVLELFAVDGDTIDTDIGNNSALGSLYDSEFQRQWLKTAAELSPATWKISFSHYNYISNGNYGNGSASFKDAMRQTLCDQVQFHIQGHEHDLRWLKPEAECGRTEFIVSGAGGRTETRPADLTTDFPEREGDDNGISDYRGSAGFMWASIIDDQITVEWYGEDVGSDGANPQPLETFIVTLDELGFGS
jgi:hypothetical protein